MSPLPTKKSSFNTTMQLFMAGVMVLVVLIFLVFMFAPSKPVAPPPSQISVEERPTDRAQGTQDASERALDAPDVRTPAAPEATPGEAAAAEPGVATAAAYSISGRVTDSRSGEPIQDARVLARLQEAGAGGGRSVTRTVTNAEGAYVLEVPAAGDYHVEAVAADYMAVTEPVGEIGRERPQAIADLSLSLGAMVSGRVTETGTPTGISGLVIHTQDQLKRTTTDERGEYVLSGLAPGEHGISVRLEDTAFKAAQALPFQRVTINSPEDEVRGIDFTLDPAGVVWGYVMTPDRQPVSTADVLLTTSESPLTQALNSMIRRAPPLGARSEEDGYYELVGVPLNQEYRLHSSSQNFSPQLADPFVLTSSHRQARVDIFMFSGSNVSGRVVDRRRNPIADAEVMCIPSYTALVQPMSSPQAFRGGSSDQNGNFLIEELPAGNYQMFARKQGYKIALVGEPVTSDGYNTISGVQLMLEPVDEGEYAVFGTVKDTGGAAIDGAQVRLEGNAASFTSVDRETSTSGSGEFRFDGVESGEYGLTVTKEGYAPRRVGRVALNRATNVFLDASALVRGRVVVQGSSAAPDSYQVSGIPLRDSAQGSLDIMRFLSEKQSQSFSDPEGHFELYLNAGEYRLEATAAEYTPAREVIILTPGEVLENVLLELRSDGARIAGTVRTRDGSSPQGARVMLLEGNSPSEAMLLLAAGDGGDYEQMMVGADGEFEFERLAEGNYVVVAQHERYATANSGVIPLSEGGNEQNVQIMLGAGGALEGYVFRDGQPRVGVMVVVFGNGETSSTTTDGSGYYHVDGLATGQYQAMVVAAAGGGLPTNPLDTEGVPVDIEDGETTRYDFGTGEGTRIEGVTVPPPPPGLMAGAVVLRQPGMGMVALGDSVGIDAITNGHLRALGGSGEFVLNDVPPGEWQIDVYYVEPGGLMSVRYVHTELIQVSGEDEVMHVELGVMY